MSATQREKLKEIFENTTESDFRYEGTLDSIDYYSLFCQAAAKKQLFQLFGNNVCMANYKHDGKDAIVMIFSIPINTPEDSGAKSVAERVMEIVRETEECFITIDHMKSVEVKEEKFVYVTAMKILNGG